MIEQKIKRDRFDELLNQLRKALQLYDSKYYAYKKFNLFFANGERINYCIPENSVAHLLGVDTNYLNSTSLLTTKSSSSIDVLRELCNEDNSYMLYKKINEGILELDKLFSKHIDKKIDIFEDNIKPIIYNMEFICKINRNKIHSQGIDYMNIDYIICSKDQQDRYLLLGIVNNGNSFAPRTSKMYETEEELVKSLKDVLFDQEMTFASGLKIFNYLDPDYRYNPIVFSPDNKKEKFNQLSYYRSIFSTNINVNQDYKYTLEQSSTQYTISKAIVEYMKQGVIIDLDELNIRFQVIPEPLKIIVNEYNNSLCSGGNMEANEKFSDLANENRTLKETISTLRYDMSTLTRENEEIKNELQIVKEENKELSSCFEEISKTLSKVRK